MRRLTVFMLAILTLVSISGCAVNKNEVLQYPGYNHEKFKQEIKETNEQLMLPQRPPK